MVKNGPITAIYVHLALHFVLTCTSIFPLFQLPKFILHQFIWLMNMVLVNIINVWLGRDWLLKLNCEVILLNYSLCPLLPKPFYYKILLFMVQVFWDLCFLPCLVILIYHIQHYPHKSYLFDPNKNIKSYEHYNLYQKNQIQFDKIWQNPSSEINLLSSKWNHALVNLVNVQSLRQN